MTLTQLTPENRTALHSTLTGLGMTALARRLTQPGLAVEGLPGALGWAAMEDRTQFGDTPMARTAAVMGLPDKILAALERSDDNQLRDELTQTLRAAL